MSEPEPHWDRPLRAPNLHNLSQSNAKTWKKFNNWIVEPKYYRYVNDIHNLSASGLAPNGNPPEE